MGRRRTLQAPETQTFKADTRDQQRIARIMSATIAETGHSMTKSEVFRNALAAADGDALLLEKVKADKELRRLQKALEDAREVARREAARAARATRKEQDAERQLRLLLRFIPQVRDRVATKSQEPMGFTALDHLWNACGRSWARVLHRLEETKKALDDDSGTDPPPVPSGPGPRGA